MPKLSDPPRFTEWEATVPESVKRDPIWRTPAYRFASWLSKLAKNDAGILRENRWTSEDAGQLLRAVNSIGANLAEGYGRSTGRERARYYDYAKASAREARDWYFKAGEELGIDVMEQRIELLDRILRILTAIIPRERNDRSRNGRGPHAD